MRSTASRWLSAAGGGAGRVRDRTSKILLVLAMVAPTGLVAISAAAQEGSPAAPPAESSEFHPTDLEGTRFFVESVKGLAVADCSSLDCFDAGENAPLGRQYCDTETFPEGCVRRWLDQSQFRPPRGFEPPEWTRGRDFGQDDQDKPGVRLDCINGHPCVEGGKGVVQERSLEIEPDQAVGPIDGPFSAFLVTKPLGQERDFYYFGFGGSELFHRVTDNSLGLRIGFRNKTTLTEPGSLEIGNWHLIEIDRDLRNRVRGLIDGWDRTLGQPAAQGEFFFRFLFSVSRGRAMHGQIAACLVVEGLLTEPEKQKIRDYLGSMYGIPVGDGSPPPKKGGSVDPGAGLLLHWTFDSESGGPLAEGECRFEDEVGPPALRTPGCPTDGPKPIVGRLGGALELDGENDAVRAVSSTGELDQLFRMSMAAWIRADRAGKWRSIIDKRDALEDGWDLYLDPEGHPFFRIDDTTLEGDAILTDSAWHHVAAVYDGERLRLYVDGQLDRSRVVGRTISLGTSSRLVVGHNYGDGDNPFDGAIDDVRVYGRALAAPEIRALYELR